ncbi:MAG: hypothetical protein JOZ55_04275, partial [Alphaproteobacteria bacterium]|nr:hypothetical protein [Alphaproteobacteria bacterium]
MLAEMPSALLRASRACLLVLVLTAVAAKAGPPFLADDPEPTDFTHFEIYAFAGGTEGAGDVSGESGIDFNYGAAPGVQLTAVVPLG